MAESQQPLFRPSKRRKFMRKRPDDDNKDSDQMDHQATGPSNTSPLPTEAASPEMPEDDTPSAATVPSISEILRMRKAGRNRKGGIEFTQASTKPKPADSSDELISRESVQEAVEKVVNRFAPQNGQVSADVDKHMYVWSKPPSHGYLTQSSTAPPSS